MSRTKNKKPLSRHFPKKKRASGPNEEGPEKKKKKDAPVMRTMNVVKRNFPFTKKKKFPLDEGDGPHSLSEKKPPLSYKKFEENLRLLIGERNREGCTFPAFP